jgi:putative transposase
MSRPQRNRHPADFKARVALEAIKGHKTANEVASEFGVHPSQVATWKRQLLAELPHVFSERSRKGLKEQQDDEALKDLLYQQIGQLKVELDWLKKKVGLPGLGH